MAETSQTFSLRRSLLSLEHSPSWIEKSPKIPLQLAVAHDATLWMLLVDAFREQEESLLDEGQFQSALAEHRVKLSDLIARGEQIAFLARNVDLSSVSNFTLNDLEATLESLHVTFRCQHGPKPHPETSRSIRSLLNVA